MDAEFGMPIRAGSIAGPSSFAEYQPHTASDGPEIPPEADQSNCINAELVFRGCQVQYGLIVAHPRPGPLGVHRPRPTTGITDDGVRAFASVRSGPPVAVDTAG